MADSQIRHMDRRAFLGCTALAMTMATGCGETAAAPTEWVYIGPYTRGTSEGIYRVGYDASTGKLLDPVLVAKTPGPSFLEWHPSKKYLYAVNEVSEFNGEKAGSVTAFTVDARSGELTELNAASTKGPGPCHLKCSPDGKSLVVVNYAGGSTATYTLGDDGKLSEAVSVIQHEGSGPNEQRQKGPHAHGVAMRMHKGTLVTYITDLGIDKVLAFALESATAKLSPWEPQPEIPIASGSGPRHVVVHPDAPLAFVINELSSTLTSFRIDPETSVWTEVSTLSTLPEGYTGESSTAELAIHPGGKVIYGSNRGHDSLAVFAIDTSSGALEAKGHVSTQGKTPRSFAIHQSGNSLIAANQGTGNLASFLIDTATGMPKYTGNEAKVDMPVCVLFS